MKVIKLMADYHCYPLWDMSPGECGDIAPSEIPISKELQQRLLNWAAIYNETLDQNYPPDSGFKDSEEESKFSNEGKELVECLRNELGSDFSVVFDHL